MSELETVKYAPNDIRLPPGEDGRQGIEVFCSRHGVKRSIGLGALLMTGLENEERAGELAEELEESK